MRETDRQRHRQKDKNISRKTDRTNYDRTTERQKDRKIERQTEDRKIER